MWSAGENRWDPKRGAACLMHLRRAASYRVHSYNGLNFNTNWIQISNIIWRLKITGELKSNGIIEEDWQPQSTQGGGLYVKINLQQLQPIRVQEEMTRLTSRFLLVRDQVCVCVWRLVTSQSRIVWIATTENWVVWIWKYTMTNHINVAGLRDKVRRDPDRTRHIKALAHLPWDEWNLWISVGGTKPQQPCLHSPPTWMCLKGSKKEPSTYTGWEEVLPLPALLFPLSCSLDKRRPRRSTQKQTHLARCSYYQLIVCRST